MKRQVLTQKLSILIFTALFFMYGIHTVSYAHRVEFAEGDTTTREIAENTPAGTNIGEPLRYSTNLPDKCIGVSFSGPNWRSFNLTRVSPGNLQLKTKAPLNYEKKNAYQVRVTVLDWGSPATDVITVNITVTNVNEFAPIFTEGDRTTREIEETAAVGTNVGDPVSATDADMDETLEYSLSDNEDDAFEINSSTGQLRTKATLDYETKSAYTMTVSVSDGSQTDSIIVTINVLSDGTGASAPTIKADRTASILDSVLLKTLDREALQARLQELQAESDGSLKYQQAIALLEKVLASMRPDKTALLANYPNPFNPETWIPYHLGKSANVEITIYNGYGTVVRHLDLGHQSTGYYMSRSRAAYWDGRNDFGERVASGIYFYQLQADTVSPLRKMVILK